MEDNIQYTDFNIDGTIYKTTLNRTYHRRKGWEKPNPKKIHSVIPGTIREVFVEEGQKVKAGQPLLILEAMKMRNKVLSPFDGTIKLLNIKSNESLAKGVLLIEFE